ncbi:MAG: SNF2-related protein [Vampirovibrionales bacterium]
MTPFLFDSSNTSATSNRGSAGDVDTPEKESTAAITKPKRRTKKSESLSEPVDLNAEPTPTAKKPRAPRKPRTSKKSPAPEPTLEATAPLPHASSLLQPTPSAEPPQATHKPLPLLPNNAPPPQEGLHYPSAPVEHPSGYSPLSRPQAKRGKSLRHKMGSSSHRPSEPRKGRLKARGPRPPAVAQPYTEPQFEASPWFDSPVGPADMVAPGYAPPPLLYTLHYGYIKGLASPGAWRRGVGTYKAGQVVSLMPTPFGVAARVKGSYKEAYDTQIAFLPERLAARCSCPLSQEWCKHTVAVALAACDSGLWHEYMGVPLEDFSRSQDVVATAELYSGSYRMFLSESRKPGKISLKIQERQTGRLVKHIEPLLMQILELQHEHHYQFNDATQREISVLKYLYHLGFMFTKDGWYHLPPANASELLSLLVTLEEVCDPQYQRMVFEPDPLQLHLGVNVSMAGNVLVSIHWHNPETGDVFPLEDVRLFAPNCPFGIRHNRVYPLANQLSRLPKRLIKATFTDIRDAEGGKFLYEELPRLRGLVTIDEAEQLQSLTLEQAIPTKMINVEMMDPALLKIRVSLDFDYDGVKVPYSKATPSTPYVMVIKKDEERVYWIKRDVRLEKAAYQALLDQHLSPLQSHFLFAEGDDAIEFYNDGPKNLGPDWVLKQPPHMDFSAIAVAQEPLKVWAKVDFDESVNFFCMTIFCRIGEQLMDIDDVREQMLQGKKYFLRPGAGYVEIPLAAILQFNRTLMALEAEKLPDNEDGLDVYRIETFKAGLLRELTEQGVELELSEKFGQFWSLITSTTTLEEVPVPNNVHAELRPYQKQGFNWLWFLYSYGLNGILADDMGLGKTLQTLTLLQHAANEDGPAPSLVVAPSSVVYNWVSEAERFCPELKVLQLTGNDRGPLYKKIKDADIVVTSYSIMRRDIRALKGYPFRHVILDESQNIKNWESQTAEAAKKLDAKHRLALSGTPIENRLLELWSVFDFLMPKFLYDVDEFRYRYVTPIEEKGNIDAERRLKKQVFPFILRRLKQDVAKDLPPKIENITYCNMTDAQQDLYLRFLEETRNEVLAKASGDGIAKNSQSILAALIRLRQICCHPALLEEHFAASQIPMVRESGKFNAMKTMVQDVVENGHRVLIYSQFVEMLKLMKGWLETEGIRYEMLTGDTPSDKRGDIVNRFNRDGSIPVFLISLKAGGTGLNLTGADYVLLYDPWWNPAAEDQAADRAHRIGQTKTVMVYRMVTRGTVEEKIMKLKDRKQSLVDSIISADRSMGKSLSFEDLKDILTPDF